MTHPAARSKKLMRIHGPRSAWKRKFIHTTDSRYTLPIANNLLNRQFDPAKGEYRLGLRHHLHPHGERLVALGRRDG
ncbi:MAG TPA: hypothetical protein PLS93_16685, partial [Accumulibacter sp.]|nr:hypothetical protein [Accumulibacter sp.]